MSTLSLSEGLEAIRLEKARFKLGFQPPATIEDLALLRQQAGSELHVALPVGYESLLTQTNGLSWDGLVIYATHRSLIAGYQDRYIEGFVDVNRVIRRHGILSDHLVFADDGVVIYTLNVSLARYEVLFRVTHTVTKSFDSFEELLLPALQTRL